MAKESSSNGLEKRPKLRFPGFDGAWSNVELGSKLIPYSEITTENNQYPPLTSSRKGLFLQTDYFNRQVASEDNTGYNIVPYGYFTYRHMSDDRTFYFNINEIVEKGIVSTLYPVFTTTDGLNSHFLRAYLNYSKRFALYCVLQKQGGSRTYMYFRKLCAHNAVIPSVEEQEKIADFIDLLDKRIKLQNEKIECLKKYKRGVVQKFFSEMDMMQWELVQLKDVVSIFDGTHQTPNYKTTGVRFISVENILNPLATQKYISEEDYRKEFKAHPEYGDVLMTRIGDIGRTCYVDFDSDMAYYVSLALFKCSSKIDGRFLAAYISTNSFQKELWERTLHIAFPKKINTGEIGECYIHLPNRERQIAIASYLDVIEKKIQLAEKQLNLMQITKAGLMQQLFI